LKAYLLALEKVVDGFAAWDRFDYRAASGHLVRSTVDDLGLFWDGAQYDACRVQLETCAARLQELRAGVTADGPGGDVPSRALLLDLLANAWRRGEIEQRYDDAVARLYRFVEGLAQLALWRTHGIKTGRVPLERLPPGGEFEAEASRARGDGKAYVQLGLQKSFQLLAALGDPLGDVAPRLEPEGDLGKLLQSRNQSLLAHGARPVAAQIFRGLFEACLALLDVRREDLVRFPVLPES
jgi:CRISPR-associated protein (TIGR02710 family)